jgi:crotonobetainyl-CoA:carnitine CoA-transferase CaiB-like acyl-CoA transferase
MTETPTGTQTGPLTGIRILDLSRILAGPVCTQLLGDYGADVIKIEKPGAGDDTRKWGPPFVQDADGNDTEESTFYLCANRNKRSVAVDISLADGQALIRKLLAKCDVLIENFRVGALAKYGLGYDDLRDEFPALVYCSITGFGQTGPYRDRAGYDFLAQGMGGIMSVTGEPAGMPMKTGIGIADIMTGMHASTGILAALRHRDATEMGQHIDLSLFETQISWLYYHAVEYLNTGENPDRLGNAHANIVPYEVFETADGHLILAAGNDGQFVNFCAAAGAPELAANPDFATNSDRIRNRDELLPKIRDILRSRTTDDWVSTLETAGVPCGPINTLDRVFDDPHAKARGMAIEMPHPQAGSVNLVAAPAKMSETPVTYRRPPPVRGEHTVEVLRDMLGLTDGEIVRLRNDGVAEGE